MSQSFDKRDCRACVQAMIEFSISMQAHDIRTSCQTSNEYASIVSKAFQLCFYNTAIALRHSASESCRRNLQRWYLDRRDSRVCYKNMELKHLSHDVSRSDFRYVVDAKCLYPVSVGQYSVVSFILRQRVQSVECALTSTL